ncbi:retinoblastoma-associated protein [Nerophis lumbriciformis]|uniref:retinoblastoma-associated protein n=1 Tax=Nerophis lumbriciformis TaxID=546530 RepID=UPI002AE04D47|nr:retinoblastoma-associated protein-like [Nerophis lumbriciformis]XP_061818211.1 retinoblastoma-associated protein-like [Nerophis lumbriciformis]
MPPKRRSAGTSQNKQTKKTAESSSSDIKQSPEHRDKDANFVALCQSLHVSDTVCDRAWKLYKTVQESLDEPAENQKMLWGACLFVTVTDMDVASFTITQVLKAVSMNVKQFVVLVRKLDVNLDTISTKVNSALTRMENKYDVSLALYQRFEKTCKNIFTLPTEEMEKEIIRSCWTMFLLAKGRALQMEDDLVISFQLLLCTLELFIKRCPLELLQPLYQSAISKVQSPVTRTSRRNQNNAKARPPEPEVDVQLLETLCKKNECNTDEVKNVYQTSFSAFLSSMDLPKSSGLPQVNSLNQLYEEHYLKSRDIDGRLFLDGDETLFAPKKQTEQMERTQKKNPLDEDAVVIPPPQTPIRAAMTSIQQLRGDLTSRGDQPSTNLSTYFQNCTVDPTQDVLKRLETLGLTFSQRFAKAVGPRCIILGKQRFTLGVKLYYKVMEAMLKSEEIRLSVQNFSKLLNDSTFHTSLLACSLEVVMATYGESSFKTGGYNHGRGGDLAETDLCFPWILNVLNLTAFDFYKVIESFIKADPTLSKDIIKHLETCENLIMERIAWRTDSHLFELLKQEHGSGAVEQTETPASFSQPLQHNHTAADLYLSPVRPGLRTMPPESPANPESQAAPPPPNQPVLQSAGQNAQHPRSNSLSLFYKKLYRLAYIRLKMLCSYLLSSHPELEPIIWTLFQHTLQQEYELMRDRHLDQLMMSAMYAICKVKSVELRFKTIVSSYKSMPNTSQETFKHVLITEGHYDSIIVFYNEVFMQRLKTNILQYASQRPPTLSPIPQIPCSPYKFPSSPLRVPGSNNVYISPMKSPRLSPGIMTPRSRMLVSIGESFGQSNRFQRINQMVNNGERSFKRTLDMGGTLKPLKRLRFDGDGQDEADGSKSGRDSTLMKRLNEMNSTCSRMKEDAESRREKQ